MPYRHLFLASAAISVASSTALADTLPAPRLSQPKAVQPSTATATDTSSTSSDTPSADTSTKSTTPDASTSTDAPPVSTILSTTPDPAVVYDKPNPAFVLTGEQCAKAIDKGIRFANSGKSLKDMVKDVRTGRVGHKGDIGDVANSWTACYSLNGSGLACAAYTNSLHYVSNDDLKQKYANGSTCDTVDFEANVGVYGYGEGYVRVTDFILTDDKGDMLHATPTYDSGPSNQGYTYSASRSEDHDETITDADGNQLKVKVKVDVPYTGHYNVESEHYQVKFKIANDAGKYFISPDAKVIVLHMVTNTGERSIKFDLRPPRI